MADSRKNEEEEEEEEEEDYILDTGSMTVH